MQQIKREGRWHGGTLICVTFDRGMKIEKMQNLSLQSLQSEKGRRIDTLSSVRNDKDFERKRIWNEEFARNCSLAIFPSLSFPFCCHRLLLLPLLRRRVSLTMCLSLSVVQAGKRRQGIRWEEKDDDRHRKTGKKWQTGSTKVASRLESFSSLFSSSVDVVLLYLRKKAGGLRGNNLWQAELSLSLLPFLSVSFKAKTALDRTTALQ